MMNILYNLEENHNISLNTIFLAGPTSRTETKNSWRKDAIKILNDLNFTGNVIVPEPRNGIIDKDFAYDKQIDWERKYLAISNIIVFWIPRNLESLPGFTTNIEFGEWFKSGKIFLGFPENSSKNSYIEYVYKQHFNDKIYNNLEELLENVIQKFNREPIDWFISDTHFNQERTYKYSRRPYPTLNDMNLSMISNWNSLVYENDTMYHLGDFGDPEYIKYLSCKDFNLIPGNYDNDGFIEKLKSNDYYNRLSIKPNNYKYKDIYLIHEPEKGLDKNAFYLYGHIHQLQMVKLNGLNVGADSHRMKPISYEVVKFYITAINDIYDKNVFMPQIGN